MSGVVKVGFVLGGAALSGVGKLLPTPPAGSAPWPEAFQWIGLVAVFVGGALLFLLERDQSAALADAADAIKVSLTLRDRRRDLATARDAAEGLAYRQAVLAGLAKALREPVEEVLIGGAGDEAARTARLGRMLDTLAIQKQLLFGMTDEQWNFAVYLHDARRNVLVCAACRRPTREASEAPHRDIAPGAGHVGKAFISTKEAVADDATRPEYRDMFEMTIEQGGKADDALVYRSIASIPIRLGQSPPVGVLVATSDRPGRFKPRAMQDGASGFDTVEPLRACAGALAILFATSNLPPARKAES